MPLDLHIAKLPRLLANRRSSAIFGMTIIAMLWTGIVVNHLESVQSDQRDAERTNQNFAMVFEENVLRSIGEIDKALLYLRRSIETRKDTTDFHTIVNTTDVLSEIIVQVAIIDAQGVLRASNAGPQPTPAVDLSDREHFRVHVESKQDLLFISRPVVGRVSSQWSVQFSRRFSNSDGSFAGVVVASLDPNHLTKFYDKIDFGASASISLIGSDGVVRSSGGSAGGFALGQDLAGSALADHMRRGINATFENVDADGEAGLITIRKVKGHPLWVSVSTNKSDILKSSEADFRFHAAAGALLTLMILAALERILRTEEKASQKADQLRLTLEHMSQGIMLVTKDLQVPVINGKCAELLGLPAELIGNPPRFDQLARYRAENGGLHDSPDLFDDALEKTSPGQLAIFERAMPDGTVVEVRRGCLPEGGFVQTFMDITKRSEAEAHVARLASEDPLTGLSNRRVFRAQLDQIIQQQPPASADAAHAIGFGVLFLDLDRFKFVNDTLGHRVGDLLLQAVATRLRETLRPHDILARLSGDEFAVVMPSIESRGEVEAMAKRLIQAVVVPYRINDYQLRSSTSVGIAIGLQDGTNADDLLMAADLALYASKASQRGTYRFYQSSMNKALSDRRQIETDLREAIERGELELCYQPIIDLRRQAVSGFEALARWHHPVKGMVAPTVFIPVAEDSGLILPLGEWALREACRQAVQWPDDLKVAVNLSPIQLFAPDFVETVIRILRDSGMPPHRLELEITERIFMEDSETTISILRRLKEFGIRIAMDDFGTGYSSLSYLRSFPFDKIKVDRTFVSDLAARSDYAVIVQAVVSIARALGMSTTAEGVETAAQHEFLAALGCDEAQGYLFSKPMATDKVSDFLATWPAEKTLAA